MEINISISQVVRIKYIVTAQYMLVGSGSEGDWPEQKWNSSPGETWILNKYFNIQKNFLIIWEVVISFSLGGIKAEDEHNCLGIL